MPCFDFQVFSFSFVSTDDNRNIRTGMRACQVTVPVWNILVDNTGSDVKHDDSTLASFDKMILTEPSQHLFAISKMRTGKEKGKIEKRGTKVNGRTSHMRVGHKKTETKNMM